MTFLQHIAKTSGSRTASSRTLNGRGLATREERRERRSDVAQALHQVALAVALPGDNTPRSYLAGDPWRGSGP